MSIGRPLVTSLFVFFFFNDTATTEIYTLSLHDALPIWQIVGRYPGPRHAGRRPCLHRSEEHTSELQSLRHLVCRLLLEKKKKDQQWRPCFPQSLRHRMTALTAPVS